MITKLFGAKRLTAKIPQIICPDGYTLCPSNNTCCLNRSLDYDCCPFVDGVCCSDQELCCPLGFSCNSDGTCTQQHVVCPDKNFCPLKIYAAYLRQENITVALHPYGHGSCCADGEHCCALGYSCNSDGTCKQMGIVCPSQKNACPLDNTCCLLDSGDYGCCPLPNAVCCSGEKCCPSGNTCNSNGTCSHSEEHSPEKQPIKESTRPAIFVKSIVATLMKQPAIIKAPQNNVCPDGSECASNNTCCASSSGGYACCPLQNAACCSDGQHCCPLGYTCDVGANTCTRVNVVCPDQNSLCPLDTTCCLHASGEYGCCFGLNATCCSDGQHCCPEGYTCNLSAGKCMMQEAAVFSTSKSIPSPCEFERYSVGVTER